MNKKAIMIRKGTSFMVNAIQKNLEDAGYEILPVDMTIAAVKDLSIQQMLSCSRK